MKILTLKKVEKFNITKRKVKSEKLNTTYLTFYFE